MKLFDEIKALRGEMIEIYKHNVMHDECSVAENESQDIVRDRVECISRMSLNELNGVPMAQPQQTVV